MGDQLVSSHFLFPFLAPRAFVDVNVSLRQLWGPLPVQFLLLWIAYKFQILMSSIFIERDINLLVDVVA